MGLASVVFSVQSDPRLKRDADSRDSVVRIPRKFPIQMAITQLTAFCSRPLLYLDLLLSILFADSNRGMTARRLRALGEFLRGVWIARHPLVLSGNVRHFHADFAGGDATMAWVASRYSGRTFSFRSHTSKYEPVLRRKLEDAKFVLAISDYERERLLNVVGEMPSIADKVHVARLGVDVKEWRPVERPKSELPRILSVGTLQEKKGHEQLIEALAYVHSEGLRFGCYLIGDGPRHAQLQGLIRSLGLEVVVELLGNLPNEEVKRLCEQADLFVLAAVTSENEGTDGIPVALMEAMALGVPCISTRVSGIPELITDGVDGVLVLERDTEALAHAIKSLLEDEALRKRLGMKARGTIKEAYSLDKNLPPIFEMMKATLSDAGTLANPRPAGSRQALS